MLTIQQELENIMNDNQTCHDKLISIRQMLMNKQQEDNDDIKAIEHNLSTNVICMLREAIDWRNHIAN